MICLVDHIHSVADLPHADTVQQLEVALLGSPVAHLINILSVGLGSTTSTPQHQVVPLTQPIATTSISPPLPTVLVVGVTDAPERGAVKTTATPSGSKVTTPPSSEETMPSKCQCIFLCQYWNNHDSRASQSFLHTPSISNHSRPRTGHSPLCPTWVIKLPQWVQRLSVQTVHFSAYKQGLYADAYPLAPWNLHWQSHMWQGISKCCLPEEAWRKVHAIQIMEMEDEWTWPIIILLILLVSSIWY